MRKIKLKKACCFILAGIMVGVTFSACNRNKDTVSPDPEYKNKLAAYQIWENTPKTAIPQYQIYNMVHSFLSECQITNSNAVSKNNKIRKVLFLGFDGITYAYGLKTGPSPIPWNHAEETGGTLITLVGDEENQSINVENIVITKNSNFKEK